MLLLRPFKKRGGSKNRDSGFQSCTQCCMPNHCHLTKLVILLTSDNCYMATTEGAGRVITPPDTVLLQKVLNKQAYIDSESLWVVYRLHYFCRIILMSVGSVTTWITLEIDSWLTWTSCWLKSKAFARLLYSITNSLWLTASDSFAFPLIAISYLQALTLLQSGQTRVDLKSPWNISTIIELFLCKWLYHDSFATTWK